MNLTTKYLQDAQGNKCAPVTVPSAVRWANGDDLDDKLGGKQDTIVFNSTYNASSNKAATMSDIPSSLPANGGNAATVNNHTVNTDVPSGAVFTDNNTTYKFTIGTTTKGDSTNGVDLGTLKSETASSGGTTLSLVTTGEKATWNGKQDSVAKLGSTTKPVYTSAAGTFEECSSYAGGTAVTLNGTSKAASTASFYAPTSAGTNGYILKSNGSGAPTWMAVPTIPSVTLNGSASSSPSFYAPTSAGTSGDVLISGGSGAPSWGNSVARLAKTVNSQTASGAITINASNGDLHFVTLSGDATGVTISNAVAGQSITVIFISSSSSTDRSVSISNSATYVCPDGADLTLTAKGAGYCEVNFLAYSSSKFYVRGV